MKKSSSSPPTVTYASRLTIMNEPLTASTGYVSSSERNVRLYLPKILDAGNSAASPKIFVKATQGVGKLLRHGSWNVPSGFNTLHPATPASGTSEKKRSMTRRVSS